MRTHRKLLVAAFGALGALVLAACSDSTGNSGRVAPGINDIWGTRCPSDSPVLCSDQCCPVGCDATGAACAGCAADPTVLCQSNAAGYSCPTGSPPPASDGTCSDPITNGTTDSYCCLTGQTFTNCTVDTTLVCVAPGSYGFDCAPGSPDPSVDDPALTCSPAVTLPNGDDGYCCE
jgi:hypothetical protein